MDKKIEELKETLRRRCVEGEVASCVDADCYLCEAKFLINAGYRKIPEMGRRTNKNHSKTQRRRGGMMLSIKAICKSENNEEVTIIGFELQGYCLCMTKSGTIFNAKHEDLTIVDKEYIESCAKESIDFEMADFLEKTSARLDRIQSKQLTSIILELQEYRSKIEQGTLIEFPRITETVYGLEWTVEYVSNMRTGTGIAKVFCGTEEQAKAVLEIVKKYGYPKAELLKELQNG